MALSFDPFTPLVFIPPGGGITIWRQVVTRFPSYVQWTDFERAANAGDHFVFGGHVTILAMNELFLLE